MENGSPFQNFLTELELIPLLLQRPVIQLQLIAFILILAVAGLVSVGAWRFFLRGWLTIARRRAQDRRRQIMGYGQLAVKFLLFPVVAIILLHLVIIVFREFGLLETMLFDLTTVLWLLVGYRLIVMFLHVFLPKKKAHYYHYFLALPLLVITLVIRFGAISVPLQLLAELELFVLFDDLVTLGQLFRAILSFYLLIVITRALQDVLQSVVVWRSNTEPDGVQAIVSIGRYIVLTLGLLVILGGMGFDITTLAVIGGGLSVGIGFGLQSIISNFISGTVLLFERSLRPGDVVEVGGIMGIVKKLDVRATTIRRYDNIIMIVPNEMLFTSIVTNFTQNDRMTRVMLDIGVSYNSDPTQVMDILRRVCREHPRVLDDPEPLIYFKNYGESSLDFGLGVWLPDVDYRLSVPSELRSIILAEFRQQGIEIPFPQRDLHIRSGFPPPDSEPVAGD